MAVLVIAGIFVGLLVVGLTGELVQVQMLGNTTPIAERGVTMDFIIGGIIWLIIAAVTFTLRWRIKENKKARAEFERQADVARRAQQDADSRAQLETERRLRVQNDLAAQMASGSFSEDISAPGFREAWERVYQSIFHWEDEFLALRRGGFTDADRRRYTKEAEDGIDRVIKWWREEHPHGPVPQPRY